MKFLVYGSRGWIGQMVVECLQKAGDEVVFGKEWITGFRETLKEIEDVAPDRIVCAVGRMSGPNCKTIDFLERKDVLLENIRANLSVPLFIIMAAQYKREPKDCIPVLYFGSGDTFCYNNEHQPDGQGYTELDKSNFQGNNYAIVKGNTELLLEAYKHVINARIRMPIATEHNFRDYVTQTLHHSQRLVSMPNSMTVLSDVVPVLLACLAENKMGFVNACNPGLLAPEDIVKMYEEVEGIKHDYSIVYDQEEVAAITAKRPNVCFETGKIQRWVSEIPPETKAKYGVVDKLKDVKERVAEILAGRKGTLLAEDEYKDANIYDNIVYSGPDAPTLEHQMRRKAKRARAREAAFKKELELLALEEENRKKEAEQRVAVSNEMAG